MLHSLSLRMPMNFLVVCAMLFSASKEMPLVSAASPKMADDIFVGAALVARGAHAQRGRKRRAGVSRAVAIMLAFRAQREAVQAIGAADGVKSIFAAGQQLVDIDLMADVPDEFVLGRVEDVMQGDGQFDHAEIRTEMPAVFGQTGDHFLADLFGQFRQLVQRQLLDVGGTLYPFEISAHNFSDSSDENGFSFISPPAFLSSC